MAAPKALILGISGQDGAYLAELLLSKGYVVHGTSRDSESTSFSRLEHLKIRDRVCLHSAVLTEYRSLIRVMGEVMPDEVYNLAGQTSVALSFEQPVETFESNAVGTINVLECIRLAGREIRFFNAASSECFGNCGQPATEETPFRPRSPYAIAKAAAFWTVANYRQSYGMFACSGILFNHESPLRPERFVTQKIVSTALRIAGGSGEKLRMGDLSIQRDWGWAPEYVQAMWRLLQIDQPEDVIIATGRTHRLDQFVAEVFAALGLDWRDHVETAAGFLRPSDINRSAADPSKAKRLLGWSADSSLPDIVRHLITAKRLQMNGATEE